MNIARFKNSHEKTFNKANKITKDIKELASSLKNAIKEIALSSSWTKLANKGITNIETTLDKLSDLYIKLIENKNNIKEANKAAQNLSILTGNLFFSSIFLTTMAVTGIPAMLGAGFSRLFVAILMPSIKKLAENNENIIKATKSSLSFVVFTGVMLLASFALTKIAKSGQQALIGSGFLFGIVTINALTFKLISLPFFEKSIEKGSILMAKMGASLILYAISLNIITKATKGVTFKQVAIIASTLTIFALATAALGNPVVQAFITPGVSSLALMSLGLLAYSISLSLINKATKDLKFNQILIVGGSILSIGLPVAALGALSPIVALGSLVLGTMSFSLYTFAKSLKMINDIGSTEKSVQQILSSMKTVRDFFIENSLKFKVIRRAKRYSKIMKPFAQTAKYLSKLKETGSVPSKLVYQVLDAMRAIGNYYKENTINFTTIRQSKNYQKMMKPFGKTLKFFSKLTELGSVPMKLVNQTLVAMSTIANYYKENKIQKETVKQAKNYQKMMKPFGKTLKFFDKLVKLGSVPMKLIDQTLNAMSVIANYYKENKIQKETVKQSKKYQKMMKPFGKTLKYFNKLTELGSIPMKLVNQTLVAMSTIANYYKDNPIENKIVKQSKRYKKILMSFGKTLKHFVKLKEIGTIPTIVIKSIITAMDDIAKFYDSVTLKDSSESKSKSIGKIIDNFANTTSNTQDKLTNLKAIDNTTVKTIVDAFKYITKFYSHTLFSASNEKVKNINDSVEEFVKFTKILKGNLQDFTRNNFKSVKFAVKSMKKIVNFIKKDTLNNKQRERAENNILILKSLTSVMSDLSKIDATNLSSIDNTFDGINAVDLGKVKAITNMFDAFKGINKSENIISKFTESVKEFTESCKNLMEAMNYNTDAINNIDTINSNGSITNENIVNNVVEMKSNDNTGRTNGVCITNVDEIARTIAEKINGALSVDVSDTQVQLLINGTGGNEWVISRY